MKVDLIHHWLVSMRGGEKVLEQLCRLFPGADIHTLVFDPKAASVVKTFGRHSIHTTWIDHLPGAGSFYKMLLPFFPHAIKRHPVDADFIFSSDANMVKGMSNENEVPHVCYCHSPPRYLWDVQEDYLAGMNRFSRKVFEVLTPYLRRFDLQAASGVDHFIANSRFVRERIKRIYDRESTVIHPPVDLSKFNVSNETGDYYLVVSALVPYKRVDLAVEAFNRLGKKLVVIGEGSEMSKLTAMANDNITFLGAQPDKKLREYYSKCKAFIFPGLEDFGITPLEAQASGRPVIAYRDGGALETVKEGETGLFFDRQTPEALQEAIEEFEKKENEFSSEACRKNAETFSNERFRSEIKDFLLKQYPTYFANFQWGKGNVEF